MLLLELSHGVTLGVRKNDRYHRKRTAGIKIETIRTDSWEIFGKLR